MLSNISLRWMIRQIIECRTGILLDYESVGDYQRSRILETPLVDGTVSSLSVRPRDTPRHKTLADGTVLNLHAARPGDVRSEVLDREDVENSIHNSIGWNPFWNFLEYFWFAPKPAKVESPVNKPHLKARFKSGTTRW